VQHAAQLERCHQISRKAALKTTSKTPTPPRPQHLAARHTAPPAPSTLTGDLLSDLSLNAAAPDGAGAPQGAAGAPPDSADGSAAAAGRPDRLGDSPPPGAPQAPASLEARTASYFQHLVLDCDGVLVDTERASCEALRLAVLEVTGLQVPGSFPEVRGCRAAAFGVPDFGVPRRARGFGGRWAGGGKRGRCEWGLPLREAGKRVRLRVFRRTVCPQPAGLVSLHAGSR
jgi:hypothetical protein